MIRNLYISIKEINKGTELTNSANFNYLLPSLTHKNTIFVVTEYFNI